MTQLACVDQAIGVFRRVVIWWCLENCNKVCFSLVSVVQNASVWTSVIVIILLRLEVEIKQPVTDLLHLLESMFDRKRISANEIFKWRFREEGVCSNRQSAVKWGRGDLAKMSYNFYSGWKSLIHSASFSSSVCAGGAGGGELQKTSE